MVEVKPCPYKRRRKPVKPVRSSLGNLFSTTQSLEEKSSSASKVTQCSLGTNFKESLSKIQKWRKAQHDDGMDNFEISSARDQSETISDSLTESEVGMEESFAATPLYPKNFTCTKCGRDFSSGKALGPHFRR